MDYGIRGATCPLEGGCLPWSSPGTSTTARDVTMILGTAMTACTCMVYTLPALSGLLQCDTRATELEPSESSVSLQRFSLPPMRKAVALQPSADKHAFRGWVSVPHM